MKSGVELEIDLTEHAVIGIWEAVRNYGKFKVLLINCSSLLWTESRTP